MDNITLAIAKSYVDESLLGGGAVVGKNVTISSVAPIDGGNRITFAYTLDDGTAKTQTLDVMDGQDGANGKDGQDGLDGEKGDTGVGISKIEKINTVDLIDTYEITLTDNTTFEFTVTNGKDGESGASDWSDVENKPFETLDSSTLEVDENGVLKVIGGGTGELPEMSDYYKKTETYSQSEVDNLIKDKADKTDVPSIDGLVSEEKLTETLSDYAKTEDLPEQYDDAALSDRVTANEVAITILSGSGEGSITKTVDNALNKFATDISNDGVVNTYKELVDYAASHSSDVAEMVAEIADNTTAIQGLDTKTTTLETSLENKVEKEDGKSLFSGKYEDLTGTPTIPSIEGLATEEALKEHTDNSDAHVSENDRDNWDAKAEAVEISAEDYNALDESVQNDGTMWLIPDMVAVGEDMIIDSEPKEGSGNLITSGAVYEEVSKINDDLENITDAMSNKGTLLIPYVALESGISTQTDSINNWNEYKGFVLGVECTGGDGTQYCETKYIPLNYANLFDTFRHVMTLNYTDAYSFIGFARLYVSSQQVTFSTTNFSGWTNPRWFLYGIK